MPAPRARIARLYSIDLAHIHDSGWGDLSDRAAPAIIQLLRAHGIRGGLIVEAGCGSGILAAHLVDAGYQVFGFDQSAAMIRLARARVPSARLAVASLTRVPIPRCRAVLAIGETITYVGSGVGGFFRRAHRALEPEGLFIFDFIESAERRTYPRRTRVGDRWSLVARADLNTSGRVLTRRILTSRQIGNRRRWSREVHRVRIYSREEIARLLVRAGFTFRMRRSYGRYRLMAGDVVVIAEKRASRERSVRR